MVERTSIILRTVIPTDPQVAVTTMLCKGNYDTVNAAVQWNCLEVPTGTPIYSNACPVTHTLPASLYLGSKPPFWTSMPWPAVGPDVLVVETSPGMPVTHTRIRRTIATTIKWAG